MEKQQLVKYENIKSEIEHLISEPTENKMVYQQLYNRAKFVLHPYAHHLFQTKCHGTVVTSLPILIPKTLKNDWCRT